MSRAELYRWPLYAVLAAAFALVSVYRLSTAVLAGDLGAAFDATGAELGTLHASFFVVYAALQLPAGVVADRLGSRWAIAAGTAVMSAGGALFAAADVYAVAFAGRALVGLGAAFLFVSILRFCANWFRADEFARMSGLTVAVAGLGGILATTPLALAVEALGWRRAVAGIAGVGAVIALVVALVTRDAPSDAGLDPVGEGPTPESPGIRGVARNARRVFAEPETWLAGVVLFAGTGVNITVFGLWGVPYLVQTHGLTVTAASTYTLLGSAGLLVGPPAIGYLSDRLGRRTGILVVGTVLYVVVFGLLSLVGRPPLVLIAGLFFVAGTLTGTFVLTYSVVQERHTAAASGVSTGTVNTVGFAGAAVLPAAMGVILDAYWTGETIGGARVYTQYGYRVAYALATVVALVGLACAVVLHRRDRAERAVGESGHDEPSP